jgi:hypothetical protein
MALDLNVDPMVTGPFVGAPNKSRIGSFPYGTYSKDASDEFKAVVNAGNVLPQFAISTRIPVTTEQAQVAYQYGPISHNVTQINNGIVNAAMPIAMGVGVFGSGGSVSGLQMIQDWSTSPGGSLRWGMGFRNLSFNVNSLGDTKLSYTGGVWPGFMYVWRPSTMTAVGYIASAYSFLGNSWAPRFVGQSQLWAQTWAGDNSWICWGGYGTRSFEVNHIGDTVTWLAGDMLIVEYWAGAIFFPYSATASPGSCYLKGIGQFGGGTNNVGASDLTDIDLAGNAEFNTQIPLGSSYAGTVEVPVQGENPVVAPNLTDVSPGAGPHISLTFDNPVGIVGPTIGAASDGLGVTGVTAISTTQIDLACAIRPDHPDGDAETATLAPPIGEADNLGPPIPTGIGAIII